MKPLLAILAALLFAQLAFAIDSAPAFTDPAQQARYERVIRELRCLVCRSETIADSNATQSICCGTFATAPQTSMRVLRR